MTEPEFEPESDSESASRLAELYEALHRGTEGDVAFYAALTAGVASVLELGAGFGRVLDALASGRDAIAAEDLVGLEVDDALRARAATRLGDRATIVSGDMRDFALGRRFDLIIAPHSSLYCLLDEAELLACFRAVHAHLADNGLFAFDAWPADAFHHESLPEDVADDDIEHVADVTIGSGDAYTVYEKSTWDRDAHRLDVTYVHAPSGNGRPIEHVIRQRYFLASEVGTLLSLSGLSLVALSGDFDGGAYHDGAAALVVTARRAR